MWRLIFGASQAPLADASADEDALPEDRGDAAAITGAPLSLVHDFEAPDESMDVTEATHSAGVIGAGPPHGKAPPPPFVAQSVAPSSLETDAAGIRVVHHVLSRLAQLRRGGELSHAGARFARLALCAPPSPRRACTAPRATRAVAGGLRACQESLRGAT